MLTLFPQKEAKESNKNNLSLSSGSCRIALVGGFRPRKCGIATFTTDIFEQMGHFFPSMRIDVYAMMKEESEPLDGDAYHRIEEHDREAMKDAARRMNEDGVDAVWLQHEFGIFGGESGEYVLELIDRVAAPLLVTLHTVLEHPSPQQEAILRRIIAKASRLMVMSQRGKTLLLERYGADERAVSVIEHGAPDRPAGREAQMKAALGIAEDRPVLMTFGLLGPGKGLETAIAALPAIVESHPNVLYRIVGATHPNLVAQQGESYREGLMALAGQLSVTANIEWDDRFLENEELLDQLEACDIYLTPYYNMQQSTSGTLSYAVALGKAVVSTPYIHARELISPDIGILVEPGNSAMIADAVSALLGDPARLADAKAASYRRGRSTVWSEFARSCWEIVCVHTSPAPQPYRVGGIMATPSLSGLRTMSDGIGILQHGIGTIPDRRHGYCLDDNARAMMLMNRAEGIDLDERLGLSVTFASFVQHCWNEDVGRFRNFMRYDRQWAEEQGSEDSNGRAISALGHSMHHGCSPEIKEWAQNWFEKTGHIALDFGAPRSIAFSMIGAHEALLATGRHALAEDILLRGAEILNRLIHRSMRPDWKWFEAMLGYDNPRLAEALLRASAAFDRADWREEALDALEFICERQTGANGQFRPIGSESFGKQHDHLPFDQQPLEAQAAIEACLFASTLKFDTKWREHAEAAYGWFHGHNDRGDSLVDIKRGICRDGITARGVNKNSGAESLLAYQLSYYAMRDLMRICAGEGGNVAQSRSGGSTRPVAAA